MMMDSLGVMEQNAICMVCGDRSAGKHYGVTACYGCKGFFRRTIRSKQSYACRFQQCCLVDRDQRNACRFCRFKRCLQVGMEPDAIRPDRDVIGKQKNPRKRKLKMAEELHTTTAGGGGGVGGGGGALGLAGESSSLPSPGTESNSSQQEDLLLSYLMEISARTAGQMRKVHHLSGGSNGGECSNDSYNSSSSTASSLSIGIAASGGVHNGCGQMKQQRFSLHMPPPPLAVVKQDPDISLYGLLQDPSLLDQYKSNLMVEGSVGGQEEQGLSRLFSAAMRSYVIGAIEWVNALFTLANADNVEDKLTILKNSFVSFCTFEQASCTALGAAAVALDSPLSSDPRSQQGPLAFLQLCNGAIIPRQGSDHSCDASLLANNMVGRILDELAFPIRKLHLCEQERVALSALILLDGDCRRISPSTADALYNVRDRLQNSLFHFIRERCDHSLNRASSRFANILLLLPSVAKVSTTYYENAQLAKMFGRQSLDPLLSEILLDSEPAPNSSSGVSMQGSGSGSAPTSSYSAVSAFSMPPPMSGGLDESYAHSAYKCGSDQMLLTTAPPIGGGGGAASVRDCSDAATQTITAPPVQHEELLDELGSSNTAVALLDLFKSEMVNTSPVKHAPQSAAPTMEAVQQGNAYSAGTAFYYPAEQPHQQGVFLRQFSSPAVVDTTSINCNGNGGQMLHHHPSQQQPAHYSPIMQQQQQWYSGVNGN